jgi:thiamine-phosphate pyrophosphorylase
MVREKDLPRSELVELARPIAGACRAAGALFVVNHDVEAAADLGADGVHLGFRSAGVREARAMLGSDAFVGRSTHDEAELSQALADGADYVTFGPVWDTASKRGILEARGLAALAAAVRRAAPTPVVALGGVDADRAAQVRAAGAAGVACIGALLARDDEEGAARAIRSGWEGRR